MPVRIVEEGSNMAVRVVHYVILTEEKLAAGYLWLFGLS